MDARATASPQPSAMTAESSSAASSPTSSSPHINSLLVSSQTLQHAYRHRDTAQSSALQKRLVDLLRTSTSKAETVEAFFLVAGSDKEALTPATFAQFTSALLKHNVVTQMGTTAYAAALADAVGAGDDRWSHVEPAESRAFSLFQAQRLERYAVKGTSFEEKLGLTLEGADNAVVTLTQYQLQKHASRALPASLDVLEELMHLDVSWTSALKVYAYAKELAQVDPPAGMTARLMGLMTGYRTNGLGSRPWQAALRLYDELTQSGYDVPLDAHAAALDAVWRRGDTFAKPHQSPSPQEQGLMWQALVRVRENVKDGEVVGEAGCRFSEALVKAASATGRWEVAVQLLGEMDVTLADTSSRLLVPTAETFLFAMAACNVAHNAAYATSLFKAFGGLYTLRSAHPEALATYLQSLRHVEHLAGHIGSQVEELVMDGHGLDRPCSVACLQLLSSQRVHTKSEKWRLAQLLLRSYDSNPWPQQPQARQAELQTIFRCCHLIAAASATASGSRSGGNACPLLAELEGYLVSLFGADSPECQWLKDTEVYSLLTAHSWQHALAVFERTVVNRPSAKVADLPIPLRQARQMLAHTLLKCGHAAHVTDEPFLLDEDRQEQDKALVHDYLAFAVRTVREVYAATADTLPRGITAELLLLQSLQTTQTGERQRLALEAMRELACGQASIVTPRIIDLVSQALSLTEEHVQGVLMDGSAQLREKALQSSEKHLGLRAPCLERVFL
ncbi:putative mitochondrial hypothetical protein [Leptomonas pyrrhocoris]|uniref:Uncharacterized protein n=1 Tax=Leptomonas pyrrhocoris TaxID=157538 RepID=A0A0M9FQQ9_LEPPY|nr:putative mitochondrial hypothetical protein [Leptomonas pyrrhocoris]KPA74067.1 putative mitochondrial hypothetical protein [Leptomonas pyrrhocoris]|eukprot:XP_015652506.1 putative mitochondrial hypothetical protein [Leptomonas pyrrhocoris]